MLIIQKKIRTLQSYDDDRKKRWLVGLSGVSMIVVIGLWLVYINISIPKAYKPKPEEVPAKEEKAEIAAIFRRGLARAYDVAENKMAAISLSFRRAFETAKNEAKKSRDYSIEGENLDLRKGRGN